MLRHLITLNGPLSWLFWYSTRREVWQRSELLLAYSPLSRDIQHWILTLEVTEWCQVLLQPGPDLSGGAVEIYPPCITQPVLILLLIRPPTLSPTPHIDWERSSRTAKNFIRPDISLVESSMVGRSPGWWMILGGWWGIRRRSSNIQRHSCAHCNLAPFPSRSSCRGE